MKENLNEDINESSSPLNNIKNSLLNVSLNSRAESSQFNIRNPHKFKTTFIKGENESTFEKILNDKLKREEENDKINMEVKLRKKLLKKLNTYIIKDYLLFFFLFLSSSFNFNFLFLPFIFIGAIYLTCIGSFRFKQMRLKYFLEIFVIGYTSYLLLFKIIIYSLMKNENEFVNNNYKDLFIDLGICILKDRDSNLNFIMNFLPEISIILISGYSILISFRSRLLTQNDLRVKTITNFKLSKYAFIIYVLMVASTMFNLSYLSLFYIICIQIILFLCSIKYKEHLIKKILNYMIYFIIVLSSLQIVCMNCVNIHSINKKLLIDKENNNIKSNNKRYLISKQIGINIYNDSNDTEYIITNFIGYFFSIVALLMLINIKSKLNLEIKSAQQGENNDENNNDMEQNINILVYKKSIFYKIISKIMKFLYHPVFNFEMSRILAILWTYFYSNIFSLGILIFVFISFFSPHTKRNKCLVIFILSPMLTLSLCFFHVSNIPGYLEHLNDIEKRGYMSLGIKKFDNTYLEYPLGHLFFIIVMFLINSLYTAESLIQFDNVGEIFNPRDTDNNVIEMQDLSNINRLEESILPKENNQEKNNIRQTKTVAENNDNTNIINTSDEDNENDIDGDNNTLISNNSNNTNKNNKINTQIPNRRNDNNIRINSNRAKDVNATRYSDEVTFLSLLKKLLLKHIDKITLVVMYFVSVHAVNVIHILIVLILIFQIISPKKINFCYKITIIIFQLLYIIEFVINLFKSKYYYEFIEYKYVLGFFIVYNVDINSNDIEIFIYGVIYCFYFQYRAGNIESNKILLNNKNISLVELIKTKLKNHQTIQSIIFAIGSILSHAYLWLLICLFIFFNSYFEINFIFGIKLLIFLICCLQFIFLFQSISINYSDIKCFKILNRFFLIFCCLNTLLVYLYQFLCKDLLPIKESINQKRKENNFFMLNLPNFGFTLYKEDKLYYNFIPHFLTTFICVLFISQTENILNNAIHNQSKRRFTMSHIYKEKLKKKKLEQDRMNRIKNELNEFIQDKMYADKYTENFNEIKAKKKSK